ncbi:MAG: transcriptional activator RfaH [Proteobacteria bacterium]|nr:transcriptional activator RfaH [Pseudomonadota bacterium]
MINWFVAHTQPLKELIAQQHLLEQGFEVYLPRFKKIRKHARKVEEVLLPLFPRYVFVGMDMEVARWRSVNGTRGISYLLTNNEYPTAMPNYVIQNLKSQETSDSIVPVSSLLTFTKGDKVRILDGMFKDQIATVEMFDANQRVRLLLSFMGRETRFALPDYAVEAA